MFGGVGVFMVRELIIDNVPGLAVGGCIVLLLAVWIVARAIRFMARGLRVFFYG